MFSRKREFVPSSQNSVSGKKYQKVPRLGHKINAGLTYSILAISFKIVSLGTYTAIPLFFACFRSTVDVIFLDAV
jgi:hypothetical protein